MNALTRSVATLLVVIAACLVGPVTPTVAAAPTTVTIDLSDFRPGDTFRPFSYWRQGLVFPLEQCAPSCADWEIGWIQGDEALWQPPGWRPLKGTFLVPVSELSLDVAPALQGTARYVLTVYGFAGQLLAEKAVTVTQDFGDPENSGFGHFSVAVSHLPSPATSFVFYNVFVRSSFPNTFVPFGVSSISLGVGGQR
ncbi:MAG TPA: hypothetical protein VIA10_17945 [Gaiellaceae bacterium]|jgi:hypothetical protein